MNDKDYARLVQQVRQLSPQVLLAVAARCDGHSIFEPRAFLEAGLPSPVVEYLTRRYRSDGSLKGTLFVNGAAVKELTGVYGLEVLRFLAHALGVSYRPAMGRGFEAQNIRSALQAHLAPPAETETKPGA